jgi:hypothetical protein
MFKNVFLVIGAAQLTGFTLVAAEGSTAGTCDDTCTLPASPIGPISGSCREGVEIALNGTFGLNCEQAVGAVNGLCDDQCSCTETQIADVGVDVGLAEMSKLYWSQNRASCISLCEAAGQYTTPTAAFGDFKCKAVEFTGKGGGSHAGKCELHFRDPDQPPDLGPTACEEAKCLINNGPRFIRGGTDHGTGTVDEGNTITCAADEYVLYAPRFTGPGDPGSGPVASPADPAALAIGYELVRSTGAAISCTNGAFGSGTDPAPGYLKQCTCYPVGLAVEKKNASNGCCRFSDAVTAGCRSTV